jgi:putative colanic acid biosynthesis glycosyltransferase WcaI
MKLTIICQWFPPEYAPIGVMLKELAQDLIKKGHEVTVITGFPNHPSGVVYGGYEKSLFAREEYEGIRIIRCYLYTSPEKTFFRRLLNNVSFALTSFIAAWLLPRQDLLFMVSPPLTNGFMALLLKKLKGLPFVFNVQDIYPDAAIAAGVLRNRWLIAVAGRLEKAVYREAATVAVISEGFRQNLIAKGVPAYKISMIYNWIDSRELVPLPKDNSFSQQHGIVDKFVVLYSGTIGLISGAEVLLEAAERLKAHDDILFLFVGEGVVKDRLVQGAGRRNLDNTMFLPFQPRELLSELQSSADISVVTLLRNKGKSSVPSKVLGYMAAARPVIISADIDSETARFVESAGGGICIGPEDALGLTEAILRLYHDRTTAAQMGRNGRLFVTSHCDRAIITSEYEKLMLAARQAGGVR